MTLANSPPRPSRLCSLADTARRAWTPRLDPKRRVEMGQFFTPSTVGRLMASWFTPRRTVTVLDPGAGVGSLSAALIEAALGWGEPPESIRLAAFESEPLLRPPLTCTLEACHAQCDAGGVAFETSIHGIDFLEWGVTAIESGVEDAPRFNAVIMNPPYRKIRSSSHERTLLRRIGIETSNLYTAFVAVAARLLHDGGELVAITPRSFCNGPYFRPFRRAFFAEMALTRAHVFERRDRAFGDDDVLQENVIFHAVRSSRSSRTIVVSTSEGPESDDVQAQVLAAREVLDPNDPDLVLRLPTANGHRRVAEAMRALPCELADVRLTVSTGRVVDFRAREFLRMDARPETVPLIYPEAFEDGRITWPKANARKARAIEDCASSAKLLVPAGHYVLVKRFSAKEEPRRVVAAVYDPAVAPGARVGFENHVNYFHESGAGLDSGLAAGLAAFLNSTLVDQYFRQESGHTQVNATDLRRLRYPTAARLRELGAAVNGNLGSTPSVDRAIVDVLGIDV